MPRFPYTPIGNKLGRDLRNSWNQNLEDIEADIIELNGAQLEALESSDKADASANNADLATEDAKVATTNATTATTSANDATTNANTAATTATEKATFAQEQGEYALQVADENKTTFLDAVDTVALRDSTYPNPEHGDTVRVTSVAKSYRYVDGTGWVVTDEYNPTVIDEIDNSLNSIQTDLAQIVHQAPAPNGINDTQSLKDFFAKGYKNVQLNGTYRINLAEGAFIGGYSGTDNIKIIGKNAKIIDLKTNYTNNGAITPVFQFNNCRNIEIDLDFEGQELSNPNVDLGYKGATIAYFANGCENITIKGNWNHCRYGVLSGNYSMPKLGDCKGFNIDITGKFIGYPVALYLAERVELNIVADGVHRSAYLAGVLGVEGAIYFKNQYVADTSLSITDAMTGEGTSRGCSDLNIYVEDLGSTVFQPTSVLAGIYLSRVDPYTKFSNISVKLKMKSTNTISTTMHGFRISSGVKYSLPEYAYNWEPTIEVNDITISGVIDRTEQTVSSGTENPISIRGDDGTHYATFSNINFDSLRVNGIVGVTKNVLVLANGLKQGLSFKDCSLTNTTLEIFTTVPFINIINSKMDRVLCGNANKLNLVGSTIKTVSATDFTDADITNSLIGGSGVETKVKYLDIDLSSGLTKTAAIPQNALVLAVTGIVTEAIQGVSFINVGTTTTANEFGYAVEVAVGKKLRPNYMSARDNLPRFYLSATDIVVAPQGGGTIATGKLRLCIAYMLFTEPAI